VHQQSTVETRHRTCCRVFPSVAEFCRSRRCVEDRSTPTPYNSDSPPPLYRTVIVNIVAKIHSYLINIFDDLSVYVYNCCSCVNNLCLCLEFLFVFLSWFLGLASTVSQMTDVWDWDHESKWGDIWLDTGPTRAPRTRYKLFVLYIIYIKFAIVSHFVTKKGV